MGFLVVTTQLALLSLDGLAMSIQQISLSIAIKLVETKSMMMEKSVMMAIMNQATDVQKAAWR